MSNIESNTGPVPLGRAKKLWGLDAPLITVPVQYLVDGAAGVATIPIPVFVIEHEHGLLLLDTGIASAAYDDPIGAMGDEAVKIKLEVKPEQRPDRQLEALGLSAEQVTHVVVSHLHFDHVGAIRMFPNAHLFIGPGEFEWAADPTDETRHLFDWPTLDYIHSRQPQLVPEGGIDVFGDGSVQIFRAPGHTPGQLGLRVHLPSQTFILPSDAAHMRVSITDLIPDGLAWSPEECIRSLEMIRAMRDAHSARVWITHDPEDWAEYGHAPHFHE